MADCCADSPLSPADSNATDKTFTPSTEAEKPVDADQAPKQQVTIADNAEPPLASDTIEQQQTPTDSSAPPLDSNTIDVTFVQAAEGETSEDVDQAPKKKSRYFGDSKCNIS